MSRIMILSIPYNELAGMLESSKRVPEGCILEAVLPRSEENTITVKLVWPDQIVEPTNG